LEGNVNPAPLVIPAKAGIHCATEVLVSSMSTIGFRSSRARAWAEMVDAWVP